MLLIIMVPPREAISTQRCKALPSPWDATWRPSWPRPRVVVAQRRTAAYASCAVPHSL
jgi:hypothetical protein